MSKEGILRSFGATLLLVSLLLTSCRKPVAEAPVAERPPESPAVAPLPATPIPATPTPQIAEATPAPNHLAPAGVFFLLAHVSIETPSGITGLPPGTQLQQTGPTEYLAPEGHKLTLRPDQVTNDLRIARQLAGADAAMQAAYRRMSAPPPPRAPAATARPAASAAAPAAQVPEPSSSLGASSALGAAHSRIKDGYLWHKNSKGEWVKVRPSR